MKRPLLSILFLFTLSSVCFGQGDEDRIIEQYRKFLIATTSLTSAELQSIVSDLNTSDKQASFKNPGHAKTAVIKILKNTRNLCIGWLTPSSMIYRDSSTLNLIHFGLEEALRFFNKNKDWSLSQLEVALMVRDIVILIDKDLQEKSRSMYVDLLRQHRFQGSSAGPDLILTNELGIHYSALIKDVKQIQQCRDYIVNAIQITTSDGIQPDFSFHHNGNRLNIFHDGKTFLFAHVRVAWQLRDTRWAFPQEKSDLLAEVILKAWQWMSRGTITVPGAVDSFVTKENELLTADIRSLTPFLIDIAPSMVNAFHRLENIQNNKIKPSGTYNWMYSDLAAYHDRNFSFFIKATSQRTTPTEFVNTKVRGINLFNNGNTYLVHDGKEYSNLMPVWNWQRLPGTTGFARGALMGRNDFVGVVNNGKSSLQVVEYGLSDSSQHQKLSAHKIWAMHEGKIVCLITDLKGSIAGDAFTSIDQCRLRGPVTVNKPGNVLKDGVTKLTNPKWIHHAGFVYIPITYWPTTFNVELKTVKGNWKSIDPEHGDKIITEKIFNPVIDHGHISDQPKYTGYIIAHANTVQQADSIAKDEDWHIMANGSVCQSVYFKSDGTFMVAFWSAMELRNDLIGSMEVNKPCIVLVENRSVYVCDPTHKGGPVRIRWRNSVYNVVMPPNGETLECKVEETQ